MNWSINVLETTDGPSDLEPITNTLNPDGLKH